MSSDDDEYPPIPPPITRPEESDEREIVRFRTRSGYETILRRRKIDYRDERGSLSTSPVHFSWTNREGYVRFYDICEHNAPHGKPAECKIDHRRSVQLSEVAVEKIHPTDERYYAAAILPLNHVYLRHISGDSSRLSSVQNDCEGRSVADFMRKFQLHHDEYRQASVLYNQSASLENLTKEFNSKINKYGLPSCEFPDPSMDPVELGARLAQERHDTEEKVRSKFVGNPDVSTYLNRLTGQYFSDVIKTIDPNSQYYLG
ncbi:uncharacterized protein I206_100689 [Kwoniella pini CBS 10737]|uniref:Uncharacterized protein n=1 Tax=Kwoniella pini CBS 10737 TaxID=1296096 RepID=A0A1B9ID43_9TREE|nr:uncharacterized protein I206_00636 [Kwoniella pini CBS 10737]OCF53334.1 hypothetical protein I206_00636 [Kwoniella pini CBS 10737]